MRITFCLSAVALFFALELSTGAMAARYSFTAIATREDGFTRFPNTSPGTVPIAISDVGQVLFRAEGRPESIYFAGNVGPLASVPFPQGGIDSPRTLAVNTAGQFAATTYPLDGQEVVSRITGANVDILDRKPLGKLGSPDLNDRGEVAFFRDIEPGFLQLVVSDGLNLRIIANQDVIEGANIARAPSLNNLGRVAFKARGGVLIGSGGELSLEDYTIVTDANGDYGTGSQPVMNDDEIVVFQGSDRNGTDAIVTWSQGDLSVIASDDGAYASFGDPTINNAGLVAFLAALDDGTQGIFTGSDPLVDRVIVTGDLLQGSVVSALRTSPAALNNRGEIAFWALMLDGQEGIFVASPISDSVEGDVDRDGDVDAADVAALLGAYGSTGVGSNESADLNGDGTIGLADLMLVHRNFGVPSDSIASPLRNVAVPEPSVFMLAAGGLAVLLWPRRRASH